MEEEQEILFYPDAFDCTIRDFIEQRERLRLPAIEFYTCYLCGRRLQMHRIPIVINIPGVGNRFACDRCLMEYSSEEEEYEKAVVGRTGAQ